MQMKISLADGKYTYLLNQDGQRVLRYGEDWRDLSGDKFVLSMAMKIEEMQYKSGELIKLLQNLDITDENVKARVEKAIKAMQEEF